MNDNKAFVSLDSIFLGDKSAIELFLNHIGIRYITDHHKQSISTDEFYRLIQQYNPSDSHTLITQLNAHLESLETLSTFQLGVCALCEQILISFFNHNLFSPEVKNATSPLLKHIVITTITDPTSLINPNHPLLLCLNQLFHYLCIANLQLTRSTLPLEQLLANLPLHVNWSSLHQQSQVLCSTECERIAKLEERIIAAEMGSLRARRAHALATRMLNTTMSQYTLPTEAIAFLHGPWLQSLKLALLQHGEKSELWFRQRKLTETLLWSLQPIPDEQHRARFYRVIGQLKDELTSGLISLVHDPSAQEHALSVIDTLHLHLIKNTTLNYVTPPLLDTGDIFFDNAISVSEPMLSTVLQYNVGSWFEFTDHDSTIYLKLLLRDDAYQQLLFVNSLGIKIRELSFEAFSIMLSSGHIHFLNHEHWFDHCINQSITQLYNELNTRSADDTLCSHSSDSTEKDLSGLKAMCEANRFTSEHQRFTFSDPLSTNTTTATTSHNPITEHDLKTHEQQHARLLASSLTLGTWIQWSQQPLDPIPVKLAAILPSTGRYIFTDRSGANKLELTRAELIAAIQDKTIGLLQHERTFEESITRVVESLRRD